VLDWFARELLLLLSVLLRVQPLLLPWVLDWFARELLLLLSVLLRVQQLQLPWVLEPIAKNLDVKVISRMLLLVVREIFRPRRSYRPCQSSESLSRSGARSRSAHRPSPGLITVCRRAYVDALGGS